MKFAVNSESKTIKPPDVILISTADWSNPYWTNKQHMAVQLAQRGHKVFYIESLGHRAPSATTKDFRRIWTRLKRGLAAPRKVRDNLWIWSPLVIPFHHSSTVRKLNRLLLSVGTKYWIRRVGISPQLLWTYSPLTTELFDTSESFLVVYHAVDDIKSQPGMPAAAIEIAENELSRRADIIFTTAHNLYQIHRELNSETYYFSNVADYDHFSRALDPETRVPEDISAIAGPRIGFIGAVSSYKLDFPMIRRLADSYPNWSFVFVGEIGEGEPTTDASIFRGANNLHFLGGRPYSSLPGYLKGMDVALLPNRINDYTKSMFPMKFFEYLAAGKPVVSTELPALADYGHVAAFCKSQDEFAAAIESALAGASPKLAARLAAAKEHTYEIRTEKMMRIVGERLEREKRSSQSASN